MKQEQLTPEHFAYWLQEFMEIQNPSQLTAEQTQMVKDHLALVFDKVTPQRGSVKAKDSAPNKDLKDLGELLAKELEEHHRKRREALGYKPPKGPLPVLRCAAKRIFRTETTGVDPFNQTYC